MNTDTMFSSSSSDWETPQDLFDRLHEIFDFTLDVCASKSNAKCTRYFTVEDDALSLPWNGNRCFMNPPYGVGIEHWVRKAATEKCLVVGLLPARTDTKWWNNWVVPFADIHFLRGRLKFGNATTSAPFPSAIAIWYGKVFV